MITFQLKDTDSTEPTLIYMVIHFNRRRLKVSTGQKILPADWNKAKRCPRKGTPNGAYIASILSDKAKEAETAYLKLLSSGRVTPDKLRAELSPKGSATTFVRFVEEYIKTAKVNTGTRKIFVTTFNHLKNYPKHKDFEDINVDWLNSYQTYLEGKGFAANYIGRHIVYIKQFLNAAIEAGLTNNVTWKSRKYKKPSEEAETIFLTYHELLHLYGIDLPERLDKARDLFIVGCFTGLRFSDFTKIKPSAIRDGVIYDRNIKTGERVVIPIHWVVEQILAKYPNGLPKAISNQKMNDYIKEAARLAGITNKVQKNITKGGRMTRLELDKCDLVTTHTARRSFASNAYLDGVPAISIMKITGHKTEAAFMRYVRITSEDNARLLSRHRFFTIP